MSGIPDGCGSGTPNWDIIPTDNFRVRWLGSLTFPQAGTYQIQPSGGAASIINFNGTQVAGASYTSTSSPYTVAAAGTTVPFDALLADLSGPTYLTLSWTRPDGVKEVIPTNQYTPAAVQSTYPMGFFCTPPKVENITYDFDGNRTSDGRWVYGYTSGRLTSVTTNPASAYPATTITYTYDETGRCLSRGQGGNVDTYIWRGHRRYGFCGNNALKSWDVLGNWLSGNSGRRIATISFQVTHESILKDAIDKLNFPQISCIWDQEKDTILAMLQEGNAEVDNSTLVDDLSYHFNARPDQSASSAKQAYSKTYADLNNAIIVNGLGSAMWFRLLGRWTHVGQDYYAHGIQQTGNVYKPGNVLQQIYQTTLFPVVGVGFGIAVRTDPPTQQYCGTHCSLEKLSPRTVPQTHKLESNMRQIGLRTYYVPICQKTQ